MTPPQSEDTCVHCYSTPCMCEPATPELGAQMLAQWPGDPNQPIPPVTPEVEAALAAKGIFRERVVIHTTASGEKVVEVIPDTKH